MTQADGQPLTEPIVDLNSPPPPPRRVLTVEHSATCLGPYRCTCQPKLHWSDTVPASMSAAALASAGKWPIFPCRPDKRPYVKDWETAATQDQAQIAAWWRKWPHAMIGAPMGRLDLIAIDFDVLDKATGGVFDVAEIQAAFEIELGIMLPPTWRARTPSGGNHLYFQVPAEHIKNGVRVFRMTDVRAPGGYTILPPSIRADGQGYTWIASPDDTPLAELPPELLDFLLQRGRWEPAPPPSRPVAAPRSNGAASTKAVEAYVNAAFNNEVARVRTAVSGTCNDTLNCAALALGHFVGAGVLGRGDAEDALEGAAIAAGMTLGGGTLHQIRATIKSGLEVGLQQPTDMSNIGRGGQPAAGGGQGGSGGHNGAQVEWPELDLSILEDRRGELPEFPVGMLPRECGAWVAKAACGAGTTVDFVAMPLLGIASALIGTSHRVRASSSWAEPTTLWAVSVGASGAGKTPGLNTIKRVLDHVLKESEPKIEARRRAHEVTEAVAKAANMVWVNELKAAAKAGEPAPAQPTNAVAPRPFVAARPYVSDATIERMSALLTARPSGMLLLADELSGLFANMSRYNGGSDTSFWLEAYNGGVRLIERIGRPSLMVPNSLVGITGGIQPDKLSSSFSGARDGMTGRCLFSWAQEPPYTELTDGMSDSEPVILHALKRLVELGEVNDDPFVPTFVHLTKEARKLFEKYRKDVYEKKALEFEREREWLIKSPTQVLRLAGTLQILEWAMTSEPPGPKPEAIEAEQMHAAITLMRDYFTPHSFAVLRRIDRGEENANAHRVFAWLQSTGGTLISREDIRRQALSQRLNANQTMGLIEKLIKAGWLRCEAPAPGPGRPAVRWHVNPKLVKQS